MVAARPRRDNRLWRPAGRCTLANVMQARRGLAVLIACMAAVMATGCGGDGGGGSSPTPDGGADADAAGTTWGNSSCGTCVQSSCGSEIQTCSQDPGCAAHLTCLEACPVGADGDLDPGCEANCPAASGSTGVDAVQAFDDCRQTGAGASCAGCGGVAPDGGDGGDADAGDGGCAVPLLCEQCAPSTDPNACYKCEDENCCDSHAACLADADCEVYRVCMQSECPSTYSLSQCIEFCDSAHGTAGYEKFFTRVTCVEAKCLSECANETPCVKCENDHCASEFAECDSHEACSRASFCVGDCNGDQACLAGCKAKYPGAEPALDAKINCLLAYCGTTCS